MSKEFSINTEALDEQIAHVLKAIYNPEIRVNIYELQLIYDVFLNDNNDTKIFITLTSPTVL